MKKILFIHGWNQNGYVFNKVINILNKLYKCETITLKGFGDEVLEKAYSPYDYAKEIYAKYKDIDAIVAHSYGAKVAVEYIHNYKDVPLLLVGPAIIKPRKKLKIKLRILEYKLRKKIKKVKKEYGSVDYKNSKGYLKDTFFIAINTYYDKVIPLLDSKITLIYGKEDLITPKKEGIKIIKMNPKINMHIMNGGHSSFVDNPYEFCILLNGWAKRVFHFNDIYD